MRLQVRGSKREPVLGSGCACCDRLPLGMSALGVRRDKAALSPVVQVRPGDRASVQAATRVNAEQAFVAYWITGKTSELFPGPNGH